MKLALIPALAIALIASSAQAALHPKYYEEGRRSAPNVVILKVSRVDPPHGPRGDCQVHGKVTAIERGALYRVGQKVKIAVSCVRPGAEIPAGGTQYEDLRALRASHEGRAFLDASGGIVMSQYDLLR